MNDNNQDQSGDADVPENIHSNESEHQDDWEDHQESEDSPSSE